MMEGAGRTARPFLLWLTVPLGVETNQIGKIRHMSIKTSLIKSAIVSSMAITGFGGIAIAGEKEAKAETTATAEKKKKITDRSHPDYVRCRSEKVIGSLAKRRRICMTNREWAETSRKGNSMAREIAEENTSRPGGG